MIKTLNHKELKSSRFIYMPHKIDKDAINSWILINELGEDIICESLDGNNKTIFIQNGDAQTLHFLNRDCIK
jgi:hypothetical protein